MSIIQEALKKASKIKPQDSSTAADALNTVSIEKKPAKKQGAGKMIFAILTIAVLITILNHLIANRLPALPPVSSPTPSYRYEPVDSLKRASGARYESARNGNFILNGVMQLLDGPRAIINGVVVGVGDTIGGGKIRKITSKNVIIDVNERQAVLNVED